MNCAFCQSELREGDHVCPACGHPVSVNTQREDLYFSHLASSAPPLLVRKVRSAPFLAKERRTVTAIMFTVANQSAFDQTIPREAQSTVLNEILDRITRRIFEYEGTIAKLWEKTVLTFFVRQSPMRMIH